MLKKIQPASAPAKKLGGQFAIIAARYNSEYTDALVRFAEAELQTASPGEIKIVRVPGSFEIPAIAARLARSGAYEAIICFGAILRGATTHAEHIALGVTNALAQLQIETGVPIIHGVLMFETKEQADARCLTPETNRGIEAARTALEMATLCRTLPQLR